MKIEVTLEELKDLIKGDRNKIELFGKEYTLSDQDRVIFKWVLDYRDDNNQDTYANILTTMLGILGGVVGFNKSIIEYNVPQERIEQYMSNVSDQVMELLNKCLTNYKPMITREQAKQYQNSVKNILEEESKRYEAKQQEILRSNPNSFPRKEEQQWQRFVEEHLQKQLEEQSKGQEINALTQDNNEGFSFKPSVILQDDNLQEVDSFELFIQSEPFEYFIISKNDLTKSTIASNRDVINYVCNSNFHESLNNIFKAYKEFCEKYDLEMISVGEEPFVQTQIFSFQLKLREFFGKVGYYWHTQESTIDNTNLLYNNIMNEKPIVFEEYQPLSDGETNFYGFRLKEVK